MHDQIAARVSMSKDPFAEQVERAYTLLLSGKVARAFDLSARRSPAPRPVRPPHVRAVAAARPAAGRGRRADRSGQHGARADVGHALGQLQVAQGSAACRPTDQGVSALLDDLQTRGMLDETLVVVTGEFGRTPRIGASTGNANTRDGRDHWAAVFSAAFAGGGVRGGQTIGQSDKMGAYPASRPYTPADLAATIYRALGVDPATELRDRLNRPIQLCTGEAIAPLFTG